jgi:hypothetical protein
MASQQLTIEQHVMQSRRQGSKALVSAIREDKDFAKSVRDRLAKYNDMDIKGRMEACWISRTIKTTLLAALAAANTPDVPER